MGWKSDTFEWNTSLPPFHTYDELPKMDESKKVAINSIKVY